MHNIAMSFDFGGTKLAAGLVDVSKCEFIDYTYQVTPPDKSAHSSLNLMVNMGKLLIEHNPKFPPFRIGISFGGSLSKDRRKIRRSVHIIGWDEFPLADYISSEFQVPVFIDNDANLAALGEWAFGVGKNTTSLLYVQISTGIGGGIVLDGSIWHGEGLAAEFGHMKVDGFNNLCVCGQSGCVESIASGWALKKTGQELFEKSGQDSILSRLCHNDAQEIDARLLFSAMKKGDPEATQVIDQAFTALGFALSNAITIIDPAVVILGGSVCKSNQLFAPILERSLKANLLNGIYKHLCLKYSILNGKETLLGAAILDS
jgi:glucokinase